MLKNLLLWGSARVRWALLGLLWQCVGVVWRAVAKLVCATGASCLSFLLPCLIRMSVLETKDPMA